MKYQMKWDSLSFNVLSSVSLKIKAVEYVFCTFFTVVPIVALLFLSFAVVLFATIIIIFQCLTQFYFCFIILLYFRLLKLFIRKYEFSFDSIFVSICIFQVMNYILYFLNDVTNFTLFAIVFSDFIWLSFYKYIFIHKYIVGYSNKLVCYECSYLDISQISEHMLCTVLHCLFFTELKIFQMFA